MLNVLDWSERLEFMGGTSKQYQIITISLQYQI